MVETAYSNGRRFFTDMRLNTESFLTKMVFPILPPSYYVSDVPDSVRMLPICKRSATKEPSNTILCSFEKDTLVYRHVRAIVRAIRCGRESSLESVLQSYQKFYAVAGFDLSVCINTNPKEQNLYALLNQLINAVLAVNGIKILANIRIGSLANLKSLVGYPRELCCCTGVIGCRQRAFTAEDILKLQARIYMLQPKLLLLYGSQDHNFSQALDELGQAYRFIQDYNEWCRYQYRRVA